MAGIKSRVPHVFLVLVFIIGIQHLILAQLSGLPAPPNPAETSPADDQSATTPEPGTLTIKKNVRQVILDVVVTDAHGKPIHGLAKNDFQVNEDGVAQKVLSFEGHNLDVAGDMPKLPRLPANTFINLPPAAERGPLYVLLLDLVNTAIEDQITARQQLLKFIKNKPDGTRFCVLVLGAGLHLIQGFTDDKKLLYAALDPNAPKNHVPRVFLYGGNYGHGDPLLTISALTSIAQFLSGLPERKNLIWMAGGFPFIGTVNNDILHGDLKQVIATTTQAQIAIYPMDLGGLVVNVPARGAFIGQGHAAAGNSDGSALSFEYMEIDELARDTGGQATYGMNDLKGALDDAVQTGGHYYTLTYSPANQNYDGTLRKIHVDLSNREYKLAYRSYYFAVETAFPMPSASGKDSDSPQPAAARSVTDSLYANMQHGAPLAHQLVFRAHMQVMGPPAQATPEQMENLADQPAYFRVRKKNKPEKPLPPILLQPYAVDFTLMRPKSAKADTSRDVAFEVASAAFNTEGQMLNGVVQNAVQDTTASDPNVGFYRVHQLIDVPLPATSIRIAVRDMLSDHIGAMEIELPLAAEPKK
jgi:VWFA-related protein